MVFFDENTIITAEMIYEYIKNGEPYLLGKFENIKKIRTRSRMDAETLKVQNSEVHLLNDNGESINIFEFAGSLLGDRLISQGNFISVFFNGVEKAFNEVNNYDELFEYFGNLIKMTRGMVKIGDSVIEAKQTYGIDVADSMRIIRKKEDLETNYKTSFSDILTRTTLQFSRNDIVKEILKQHDILAIIAKAINRVIQESVEEYIVRKEGKVDDIKSDFKWNMVVLVSYYLEEREPKTNHENHTYWMYDYCEDFYKNLVYIGKKFSGGEE